MLALEVRKDLNVDGLVRGIEQSNGLRYWSSRQGEWEDRGFGAFQGQISTVTSRKWNAPENHVTACKTKQLQGYRQGIKPRYVEGLLPLLLLLFAVRTPPPFRASMNNNVNYQLRLVRCFGSGRGLGDDKLTPQVYFIVDTIM